ncbi:MAG: Arm DNA-binding domain-containing protein, partial [Halomonas sp.]
MTNFSLKRKITESAIKHAQSKGIRTIHDIEISGFMCTIYRRDLITFSFRYRSKLTSKRPVMKIGRYPSVSAEEAREIAKNMSLGLAKGIEPRLEEDAAIKAQKHIEEQQRLQDATIIKVFLDTVYRPHKER